MARSALNVFILAGGRGERFWPLSRGSRPKPLTDLGTGHSFLQETVLRARRVTQARSIRVVAGADLAPAIRRDLRGEETGPMVVEPASRNTGPAALLVSRLVAGRDPQGEVLLLPSDHRIIGLRAFRQAVTKARRLARQGYLVMFGVPPRGPSREYGYAIPGERIFPGAHRVIRFEEKPDPARARALLRTGALWNSGMFVWRAGVFLSEAARSEPAFRRWLGKAGVGRHPDPEARRAFGRLPSIPVDKAVLERSDRVAVVRADFAWSDLGAWPALYDIGAQDGAGNVSWGVLAAVEATRNLAFHPGGLTVLFGVSDLMVIRDREVVLVCPRGHADRLRDLLRELERRGLRAHL